MIVLPAPTSQRSDVRPISFVLQRGLKFDAPITLNIRPTDLTRNEPSRATVTQTLGRGVTGWVDNFGEGIPSLTISGHTGWRSRSGSGQDGVASFLVLNQLIAHEYHAAMQSAIDKGESPESVKLIFVDTLDDFVWSVIPMVFALQRSKSQPLLMKYNMQLQAIDTNVEKPIIVLPVSATTTTAKGLKALNDAIDKLESYSAKVQGLITSAVSYLLGGLATIAGAVKKFLDLSVRLFKVVSGFVNSIKDGFSRLANSLIGIAQGIAQVGVNIMATINAITGLPGQLKAQLTDLKSKFNEIKCVLKNALHPKDGYDDFSAMYGASNCSSTTGGSQPSSLANVNAFSALQSASSPVQVGTSASSGIGNILRADPVLAPMPLNEIARNISLINNNVVVA
ncbi:hypothetical protein [Polynucleobacter sp.]|uniref:hypothetical protein n=1 Tax=Polynucleobacter sp. TaxID=2029855 RepID=UPI003F698F67